MRNKRMLVFALLFGVLAVAMFRFYEKKTTEQAANQAEIAKKQQQEELQKKEAEIAKKYEMVKIVSAGKLIQENTTIVEGSVGPWEIRKSTMLPDMVPWGNSREVIGKIARYPIFQGEAVRKTKLTDKQQVPKLAYRITSGLRAVSISTNQVASVSGFIRQGDMVDVIATFSAKAGKATPFSRTILQNVKVLAMGNTFYLSGEAPIAPTPEGEAPKPSVPAIPGTQQDQPQVQIGVAANTITLEVPLKDAEKLALALEQSKIHLVLRNPTYKEFDMTDGVDTGGLTTGPSQEDLETYLKETRKSEQKEIIIQKGTAVHKVYVDKAK